MHDGQEVTITEHGQPKFKVVPVRPLDRRQACIDLMAIGPVHFKPRR
jgi:prevent-host-death family protein